MGTIIDIRTLQRLVGPNLVAQIGREMVTVEDLSAAGVRLLRPNAWVPRRNVEFRLIPRQGDRLDLALAVATRGHVVAISRDHLSIAFAAISDTLARLIRSYADTEESRILANEAASG